MSEKIKNICLEIIDKCVCEFKKEENMNKVKSEILDPCVSHMMDKIYPYILATCVIFVLTFLLATAILIILIFKNK
jgi:hypothetical protein